MKKKLAVVVTMAVVLMTGCGAKENKTANNTEVPVTEAVADTEEPEGQEIAGMEAKASAGEIVIASNTDTGVAAEEVATKETADTGASGNKTSGNKSNTSSGAAASTSTNSNSNSGNTGSGSGSGTAHKHTWVAHEGSGHYETKVIKEAWDEPVYSEICVCNDCGADITNDPWGHIDTYHSSPDCKAGWHSDWIQTGTKHHDAETTQVWVQDVKPYAQCSECGEIGPVGAGISFN